MGALIEVLAVLVLVTLTVGVIKFFFLDDHKGGDSKGKQE